MKDTDNLTDTGKFRRSYDAMMLKKKQEQPKRNPYLVALVVTVVVIVIGVVVLVIFTPVLDAGIATAIFGFATFIITNLFIAIRTDQTYQQNRDQISLQLETMQGNEERKQIQEATFKQGKETAHALNSVLDENLATAKKLGRTEGLVEGEQQGREKSNAETQALADQLYERENPTVTE